MKSAGIALTTGSDYDLWAAELGANFVNVADDVADAPEIFWSGKLPYIHVMFHKTRQPNASIQTIAAGLYNDLIIDLFEKLKLFVDAGGWAVVPYLPEMNGNWVPAYATDNYSTEAFKEAYRWFVNTGRSLIPGDRVQYCWAPNITGWETLKDWYPGDEFVDVVGGSAYNWGGIFDWYPWESFTDLADSYVREVRGFTQKPIVITQTGAKSGDPRTPAWLDDAVFYTKEYQNIDGFIYFSIDEGAALFEYEPGPDDWNRRTIPLNTTEVCSV